MARSTIWQSIRCCLRTELLLSVSVLCGCSAPPAPTPSVQPTPWVVVEGLPGAVQASFEVGKADDWLALPWPNELRRRDDGMVDLRSFPARDSAALHSLFDEIDRELLGFSLLPVLYVRFSGALEPGDVAKAIETGRVRLVDVDPKSPERRSVHALQHRYFSEATAFLPAHTLALRPRVALRERTLYALVIARKLTAKSEPLGTSRDLEVVKQTTAWSEPQLERARRLHAPAFDAVGLERQDVALISVFRTQEATVKVRSLLESALAVGAEHAPKLLSAVWADGRASASYFTVQGYYCTPSFQSQLEHAPFVERGGIIESDARGRPRVANAPVSDDCGKRMRARFVLTVPRAPAPERGWPLLLHAHGTTGDAFSGLGSDNFAERAAQAGMASVSTDQPLHGSDDARSARPGSDKPFVFRVGPIAIPLPRKGKGAELAFYNVLRPPVLRDNVRQAVVDAALLARLMLASDLSAVLAAQPGRSAPRFDRRFGYVAAGHSQGSQSMALLGAVDPLVKGVLLSACGGDFSATTVHRADSRDPMRVISTVLGLSEGELDEFHPLTTILQSLVDPVDPQSFGRSYHTVTPPRSVLMVNGIRDSMTLDRSAVALASTLKAPPIGLRGLPGLGLEPVASVQGNAPRGKATFALLVLEPRAGDGHFVFFDEPIAHRVSESFLRAIVGGDVAPTVRP